jgi:hypothetical protein
MRGPVGNRPWVLSLGAIFLALSLSQGKALAHGVTWRVDGAPTVSLSLAYSDGEPMAYAAVKVFSPDGQEVEYQSARADRNGGFAFRPDKPGLWSFSASDGQGHLAEGSIEVSPPQAPSPGGPIGPSGQGESLAGPDTGREAAQSAPSLSASGGSPPLSPERLALGLSLILNLGLIGFVKAKKKPK